MRELKKSTSAWIKDNIERRFAWQEGYAALTVSPSGRRAVHAYIQNQEKHHKKQSSIDELTEFLGKAGVIYDPKYLL